MPRLALVLLLGLAACAESDSGASAPADMQGWRFAPGKPPTRAEYNAIVAACQAGAVRRSHAGPFDACLADLGLKRAP